MCARTWCNSAPPAAAVTVRTRSFSSCHAIAYGSPCTTICAARAEARSQRAPCTTPPGWRPRVATLPSKGTWSGTFDGALPKIEQGHERGGSHFKVRRAWTWHMTFPLQVRRTRHMGSHRTFMLATAGPGIYERGCYRKELNPSGSVQDCSIR